MLGYSEATIERKAEARGLTTDEFRKVLVTKRQTRNDRRRAARDKKFEGTRCVSENGKCECPRD